LDAVRSSRRGGGRVEVELQLASAEAHDLLGNDAATQRSALRAVEAARPIDDAELFARSAWWVARRSPVGAETDLPIAITREALQRLDASLPSLRVQLLANLGGTLAFAGDPIGAGDATDTALALAREVGDPTALAEALIEWVWARLGSPDV